jgi:4,5-dihydroxyphthalate decarboxylase
MKLRLSLAASSNPRTWAIHNGTVQPDGIDLIPSVIHPSEMFWRQLRFADFDVSEMSYSSLLMITAQGDDRWIGLPIFTTRRFFHSWILVRKDSGIEKPEDLKGKRVGVPEFQQTSVLWSRGILEHEFGVKQSEMEFWMERVPDHSHAGATGLTPGEGVVIKQIPAETNIGEMMLDGRLDATLHYIVNPNLVDRSTADLWNHPDIKYLFPDPNSEGKRYFEKTGIYPVNHGMVIRRSLAEEHPWVALNIYKAFERANAIAEAQRMEHVQYHYDAGLVSKDSFEGLKKPVVHYGIRANRKALETCAAYSYEQGLTSRLISLEECFAASTMEQ